MKLHLLLISLFAAFWFSAISVSAASPTYEVTGVVPSDVLNIRLAPRASAPKVGAYGPNDSGIKIFDRRGNWVLVGRANAPRPDGWVRAIFLRLAVAGRRVPLPLRCLGTEPFWSLTINSVTRATYDDPETPRRRYRVSRFVRSGSDATLRLDGTGRVAIAADSCSDGMSDNEYPYTTRVRLPDGRVLNGCCR